MAGTDSRFSPKAFRDAIHFAINMSTPQATVDRATFRWVEEKTFAVHDPANLPYSWTETPATDVTHADVQVPVAVHETPVSPEQTDLGTFNPAKAVLTILDEDYAQVEGAQLVSLGQKWYDVQFVAPPVGLFDVTIYKVYVQAKDTPA